MALRACKTQGKTDSTRRSAAASTAKKHFIGLTFSQERRRDQNSELTPFCANRKKPAISAVSGRRPHIWHEFSPNNAQHFTAPACLRLFSGTACDLFSVGHCRCCEQEGKKRLLHKPSTAVASKCLQWRAICFYFSPSLFSRSKKKRICGRFLKKEEEEALMVLLFKFVSWLLGVFGWASGTFDFILYFFFNSGEETIMGFSFPLAHRHTGVQTEETTEEAGG